MTGDIVTCARELVLCVFRLAVADYVGIAYGHDEPYPDKFTRINPALQAEAADFLTSQWAAHLGDLAGFPVQKVWKQGQRDRLRQAALSLRPGAGPPQPRPAASQDKSWSQLLDQRDRAAA